jgi:sRNA-binding carbon storage regulator CsrA
MLVLKQEKSVPEKELVLGDYVTIHVSAVKGNQIPMGEPRNSLLTHEDVFQRSLKLRGELNTKPEQVMHKRNNVIYRGNRQQTRMQNSELKSNTG